MRYARDPNEFTKRNVLAGRKTAAIGDKRRAEFAKLLQGIRNLGAANVATIGQEGQDRRLEAEQRYGLPAQQAGIAKFGAETEKTKAGTEGERFYQGLTKKYGENFMRKALGAEYSVPEETDRFNYFANPIPEWLGPKSDVANPKGYGISGSWVEEEKEPSLFEKFKSMFSKKKKLARYGSTAVRG
jgi:hypothetical protein